MDTSSNKKIWISVGVIVLILLIWWVLTAKPAAAPAAAPENPNATTTASVDFNQELNSLNQADLNAEFKDINTDTSKL